ncbi:glycoside hydrolase family 72 protein [Patellaria atrata CBS 101060]|uniref:1,3-beta-glucanosyltransferase n=1 Tax=Patellaria atrata CBS 101060 TaxID=1346257 RepID=A0A9P4VK85_9PEZI|nr:glycoside hydrolase family 72 protein [Patellaria atrata CBS 101060]
MDIGPSQVTDLIVIKGAKFFYETNGTQFFIKGTAYQPDSSTSYVDPLSDPAGCTRDIPYFQELGLNTIRVYAVKSEENHDDCMTALQEAGIYVLVDLTNPTSSINRVDPEWDDNLYTTYTDVIDAFALYNNLLGFIVANEVVTDYTTTPAAAYIRAAIRDMKAYISAKNYRPIPIGVTNNDDLQIKERYANYLACDITSEANSAIDFLGTNLYSWCGDSDFISSGYSQQRTQFENYPFPWFLSEYGCNAVRPRSFSEVQAIYDEMSDVLNGGIVYQYFQSNDYGLIELNDGDTHSVETLDDFDAFSSQIARATSPSSVNSEEYTPGVRTIGCPTTDANWSAGTRLPTPPPIALRALSSASKSNITRTTRTRSEVTASSTSTIANARATPANGLGISDDSGKIGTEELSLAAKIAIGIVVPLVVVGLLFFLYRQLKRRKIRIKAGKQAMMPPTTDQFPTTMAHMPPTSSMQAQYQYPPGCQPVPEANSQPLSEAPAMRDPVEAHSTPLHEASAVRSPVMAPSTPVVPPASAQNRETQTGMEDIRSEMVRIKNERTRLERLVELNAPIARE